MKLHIMVLGLAILVACGGSATDARREVAEAADQPASEFVPFEPGSDIDQMIDDTLANVKASEAATFPCSLFSAEEIEALLGAPVDSGSYAFEHRSVSDMDSGTVRKWRAATCAWYSLEDDGPEVDELAASGPGEFDSGSVECPPAPAAGSEPVDDLGSQAWWEFAAYGNGKLTVCSPDALVEAEVTVRGGESAALLAIARQLAEKAMAAAAS